MLTLQMRKKKKKEKCAFLFFSPFFVFCWAHCVAAGAVTKTGSCGAEKEKTERKITIIIIICYA